MENRSLNVLIILRHYFFFCIALHSSSLPSFQYEHRTSLYFILLQMTYFINVIFLLREFILPETHLVNVSR